MFEKLNYIELSGEKYPIWCGMEVLEKIQENYGDLSSFENKLEMFIPDVDASGKPKKNKEGKYTGHYQMPDIKALNDALYWMISTGLEIKAEEESSAVESIERKEILRKVDITPYELGHILHQEFGRCFARKNGKTT